jgi:hypothetical protein
LLLLLSKNAVEYNQYLMLKRAIKINGQIATWKVSLKKKKREMPLASTF